MYHYQPQPHSYYNTPQQPQHPGMMPPQFPQTPSRGPGMLPSAVPAHLAYSGAASGGRSPAGGGPQPHYMNSAQMGTPTPSQKSRRPPPSGSTGSGGGPPSMAGAGGVGTGNASSASGPPVQVIESVDDEEDTSRGDVLDHLTPREISTQRYVQHQEWLEEVLNSVYQSSQILPGSSGIEKLSGPLKPLVEGVFNKDGTVLNGRSGNEACKIVQERAEKMIADIDAEIEELEAQHERDIEDLKNGNVYLQAERELRSANVTEFMQNIGLVLPPPVELHHLYRPHNTHSQHRTTEQIVSDLEQNLDVKVIERDIVHVWNPQPAEDLAQIEEMIAAHNASISKEHEEMSARENALALAKAEAEAARNAKAAAAAAGGGGGANGMGLDGANDDAMVGVTETKSTSPENARYLVPVVIDKKGPTIGSSVPGATSTSSITATSSAPRAIATTATALATTSTSGASAPTADTIPTFTTTSAATTAPTATASAITTAVAEDSMMEDAEPFIHTSTESTIPTITAPTTTAGLSAAILSTGNTPGHSPAAQSPFAVTSPASIGLAASNSPLPTLLDQQRSRTGTPVHIPSPLSTAALLEQTTSTTAIVTAPSASTLQVEKKPDEGTTPTTAGTNVAAAIAQEPPTVPGDEDIPEGFVGGDDEFGGGDAADAMDLLGAESSNFADQFDL